MIQRDIARQVSDRTDQSAAQVQRTMETLLEVLLQELIQAGRLEWRGFGTFSVKTYPARKIHNPATGGLVSLSERKFVAFKPGRDLRRRLSPPTDSRPSRTLTLRKKRRPHDDPPARRP